MCISARKINACLFIVKSLSQTEKRYNCLNLTQCCIGVAFIYVVCDFFVVLEGTLINFNRCLVAIVKCTMVLLLNLLLIIVKDKNKHLFVISNNFFCY